MSTQTRNINIKVVTEDASLRRLGNSLAEMNSQLKKSGDALSTLKGIASGIAGASIFGFGVREISGMVDSMILLESRIQSLTGNAEKTADVMGKLKDMANQTRLGIADTAESFTRIATATVNLNLPTQVTLDLTKGLIQSFRLAGATAAEAAGATIQFGQALAFGKLSGQELRSVTSQNAVVAGILQKSIEGTGLSMKEFAEKGKFTTAFLINNLLPAFKELDTKADKMGQTFGQSVTLGMNRLTVKLAELNKEFNLNGQFAQMVDWLLNHGDELLNLITALAISAIPKLTVALYEMAVAASANPYVALGLALGALSYYALDAAGGIGNVWKEIKLMNNTWDRFNYTAMSVWFGQSGEGADILARKLREVREERDRIQNGTDGKADAKQNKNNITLGPVDFGSPDQLFPNKMVLKVPDTFKMAEKATINWKEEIGKLNIAFNKSGDSMKVWDYNTRLLELSMGMWKESMAQGEMSIKSFDDKVNKLKMENLVREFEYGIESMDGLNSRIKEFQIEELRIKFEKGKTSAGEFYSALAKLQDGFNGLDIGIKAGLYNIKENIGSAASMIENVVANMSDSFEDNFFNMIDKHQYDFSNFVDSVLEDLTRMVIRMAVIAPIAQGFLSMMGLGGLGSGSGNSAGGGTAGLDVAANGLAFDMNGVTPYATGGIVNSPTLFQHTGGMGLMGEAGPEAIIPLKRNGGVLGVGAAPVNVNIINQSGGEVSTSEKTGPDGSRIIEVMILGKVKEGIANGAFDQTMKASYGLQRRGI